MTGAKNFALAVSLHDVSPHTWEASEAMLRDLAVVGIRATSLLVIPDHHRRGTVSENADFQSWLRDQQSAGHEVVLHGFYHWREAGADDDWKCRLITERYTAGEGEFFDLDYAEARRRMGEGRRMLEDAGAELRGFIAPAWLLGAEAERAAKDEDFTYTTRLGGFLDLRDGKWTPSQSLVYSVRHGWRRTVSLVWNAFWAARLQSHPLARLGLHPPDWEYKKIREQALRLATEAAVERRVIRYRDWIGV